MRTAMCGEVNPRKKQFTTKNTNRTKKNTKKTTALKEGYATKALTWRVRYRLPILLNRFVFFVLFFVVPLPNLG